MCVQSSRVVQYCQPPVDMSLHTTGLKCRAAKGPLHSRQGVSAPPGSVVTYRPLRSLSITGFLQHLWLANFWREGTGIGMSHTRSALSTAFELQQAEGQALRLNVSVIGQPCLKRGVMWMKITAGFCVGVSALLLLPRPRPLSRCCWPRGMMTKCRCWVNFQANP